MENSMETHPRTMAKVRTSPVRLRLRAVKPNVEGTVMST